MKLKWLKAGVILLVVFFSIGSQGLPSVPGLPAVMFGGEIPWPLAHQYEITPENSRGLWQLEQKSGLKYYNVEILDQVQGTTFIRVSELDPETFKVIFWGEGFFKSKAKKDKHQNATIDYWSGYLDVDKINGSMDVGHYLYMYPNGDITERAHMIRLVEVRAHQGVSLGLSIYPFIGAGPAIEKEHVLGARMQEKPLDCRIDDDLPVDVIENLTCEFPDVSTFVEE